MKGKMADLETVSDEGSSAKKSLKFDGEKSPSVTKSQVALLQSPPAQEKVKSWYEQTLEEENEMLNQETGNKPDWNMEKAMETVEDTDAEKILEDEDWMANEINYDDDDLMDEDELLIEEMEQEEASMGSDKVQKPLVIDALAVLGESNNDSENPSPSSRAMLRSEPRHEQSPSARPRRSPAKKKRGSPSPIATGVSLRQRNLMVGRASSKAKSSRSGPKPHHGNYQAHGSVPSDIEQAEVFLKNTKKSTKVGSNKPPKIPG